MSLNNDFEFSFNGIKMWNTMSGNRPTGQVGLGVWSLGMGMGRG